MTTLPSTFEQHSVGIPELHPPEPPPEFTSASAAEALRAAESADDELALIEEGEQMSLEAFEEADKIRLADIERLGNQRREVQTTRDRGNRARGFLLGQSTPTKKEQSLHEQGLELQKKVGNLKSRYKIYAPHGVDERHSPMNPENCEEVAELKQLDSEISDLQKHIAGNSDATPGTTGAEFKLQKLLREKSELAPKVDRIHKRFEQWQEICAVRTECQQCFDRRDELRREREEAVIAKAMKSIK